MKVSFKGRKEVKARAVGDLKVGDVFVLANATHDYEKDASEGRVYLKLAFSRNHERAFSFEQGQELDFEGDVPVVKVDAELRVFGPAS